MTRIKSSLVALLLLATTSIAYADPTGTYKVEGTNPEGEAYTASVDVKKSGDVFTITYTLEDGSVLEGTALGDNDFLSIGYASDAETGVGLMARDGKGWKGIWTYLGAKKEGTEFWKSGSRGGASRK